MTRNTAWALVAIVGLVLASVTTLLGLHVPTTDIFVVITLVVSPVVTFLLYGKQEKLEQATNTVVQQTNGINQQKDALIQDMWQHFKSLNPAPTPPVTETTQGTN